MAAGYCRVRSCLKPTIGSRSIRLEQNAVLTCSKIRLSDKNKIAVDLVEMSGLSMMACGTY